ncbi:hypothetical protein JTE90_022132 [Oedothorax gibbosus]|uniref:Uncharacterized protein n=1 Tax=Oedothorax gibbosus TaxID=931172 RepID=A0AAV6VV95_9ARAC|nr:hypothetical protein JTE90_022132 [Oedothorax gibbosus]
MPFPPAWCHCLLVGGFPASSKVMMTSHETRVFTILLSLPSVIIIPVKKLLAITGLHLLGIKSAHHILE